MEPGYIEAVAPSESKERQEYWANELAQIGKADTHQVVVHRVTLGALRSLAIFIEPRETVAGRLGLPPRCPQCCEHGIPLTRNCGCCQDWLDDVETVLIADDEPQWLCPHGIGVEPGKRC